MRKRLFQPLVLTLLMIAALSIFAVSPASAASTQVHRTTASTASARPDKIVQCEYQITAYPGLNVRSGPGTNYSIVGSLYDGEIVHANESTTYGTGYYWHYVYNGSASGWSAANWMLYLGHCGIIG